MCFVVVFVLNRGDIEGTNSSKILCLMSVYVCLCFIYMFCDIAV